MLHRSILLLSITTTFACSEKEEETTTSEPTEPSAEEETEPTPEPENQEPENQEPAEEDPDTEVDIAGQYEDSWGSNHSITDTEWLTGNSVFQLVEIEPNLHQKAIIITSALHINCSGAPLR